MKPTKEQIEDQLTDALLHEQKRSDREAMIHKIEHAIHEQSTAPVVKKNYAARYGIAAAAVMALGVGWYMMKQNEPQLVATEYLRKNDTAEHKEIDFLKKNKLLAPTSVAEVKSMARSSASTALADAAPPPAMAAESIASSSKVLAAGGGRGTGYGGAALGRSKAIAMDQVDAAYAEPTITGASNTERYGALIDPQWQSPTKQALSTFSIDVDNASYSNIRRMIQAGESVPPDAVRIEECINAFDYNYPEAKENEAFAVHTELATCPWAENHLLVKVGIKGKEIAPEKRPASNLVFLIDVSGSMQAPNKLPLVKDSLKLLLHQLDERDSVSFVVYAGHEGVALPATKLTEEGREKALQALNSLESGGSTNGGAGIQLAYKIAKEQFVKGGVNRVILASDGDFNVGITDRSQLVKMVKDRAAENVYLSILSFGTGNLNDELLEAIAKDGNGNHFYIDSIREGRRILLQKLSGTLITIAKDVKIQVEFNPQKVGSYRLIGYANRQLKDEDFNNDKVDAGDIGAGHTVTAFYEIVPVGQEMPLGKVDELKYQSKKEESPTITNPSDEWLTLKLRHKTPEGDKSTLQESIIKGEPKKWQESNADFQFASAVAMFGMKLRNADEMKDISWIKIKDLTTSGLKDDKHETRAEFVKLLETLSK